MTYVPGTTNTRTSLTSAFTQPAIGSTVSASVADTTTMFVGQFLFVNGGGFYTVSSITNTFSVVLRNLGGNANIAPSGSVPINSTIIDAGRPTIIAGANIATDESSSTPNTYVDLATPGPTVTLVTGSSALVSYSATTHQNTISGSSVINFAVSGATTIAPITGNDGVFTLTLNGAYVTINRSVVITGLNSGANIFTMKYIQDSGTHFYAYRSIVVSTL